MSQQQSGYEFSPLVEKYLDHIEGRLAEGTIQKRETDLRQFGRWRQREERGGIADLHAEDIEDYMNYLSREGYSGHTIHGRYEAIRLLYQYLARRRSPIDESPFAGDDSILNRSEFKRMMNGTKKHEESRENLVYVTAEQVEQMAETVPDPALRNELIIRLLFQTGMRRGELVGVRVEDIDREERSIRIYADKTHTNRTVYYQPSLDFLMDQWLDGYREGHTYARESPYLFVSRNSEQMGRNLVNRVVRIAAEDAGIQAVMYTDNKGTERASITPHAFRHGHGIEAVKSGIDVGRLRKHMGHADLDTTQTYLQFVQDDVKEAFEHFGERPDSLSR